MRLGERVRIIAIRQKKHLDHKPLGKKHVYTAQRCLDTGGITVVDHRHILRETVYQTDLTLSQRCSR